MKTVQELTKDLQAALAESRTWDTALWDRNELREVRKTYLDALMLNRTAKVTEQTFRNYREGIAENQTVIVQGFPGTCSDDGARWVAIMQLLQRTNGNGVQVGYSQNRLFDIVRTVTFERP